MNKLQKNYANLLRITNAISHSKNPQEVALMTAESIKSVLHVKGCALFLINRKTHELKVAASHGLSDGYLSKGPLSALRSIAEALEDGPVAIFDVADDPRIQYPEEAKKEGIASILSVPIVSGGNVIGALRVYTSTPWEFTLDDVNFVQALAQIAGMAINRSRLYIGQRDSIQILKKMVREHTKKLASTPLFARDPVEDAFI